MFIHILNVQWVIVDLARQSLGDLPATAGPAIFGPEAECPRAENTHLSLRCNMRGMIWPTLIFRLADMRVPLRAFTLDLRD